MKKKYDSPELDIFKLQFDSVLTITPSTKYQNIIRILRIPEEMVWILLSARTFNKQAD